MAFPTATVTEGGLTGAGTSVPVTLPAGGSASDLYLVMMDIGSTSATVNALTDWTELLDEAVANGLKILIYTGSGVPSNPTFVTSASTRTVWVAYKISGANKAINPQIGTTATGTSANPDPPAITPTGGVAKDYLSIVFFGNGATERADDDSLVTTFPTNYALYQAEKTGGTTGTNIGGLIGVAARQINSGASIDPGTFTTAASAAWRAQHILVHPITPTATTVGRVSLAAGNDPGVDTGHSIKVRARKTSGTGTVTLTCSLYEGATLRAAGLTTSALTTSLADYTLSIAEIAASGITDYSNLEIRFNGDSSTGDSTSIEIAEIYLEIPEPVGTPKAGTDSGTGVDASTTKASATTDANSTRTETTALAASNSVTDQQSAATQFVSLVSTNSDDQTALVTETSVGAAQHARTDTQTAVTDTSAITSKAFSVTDASTAVTETAALSPISASTGDSSASVTESSSLVITNSVSDTDSNQTESEVALEVTRQTTDASTSVTEISSPVDRQLTASDSNSASSEVVQPLAIATSDSNSTVSDTSSKEIAGTTTAVARVSLAEGHTPFTRTEHKINLRARKLNSGHTGSIFVRLYEGATPRSADLEAVLTSTSFTNFQLSISDADAASITDYSNLELRFRATSAAGDPIQVEIAKISLDTPPVSISTTDSNSSVTESSAVQTLEAKSGTDSNSATIETAALSLTLSVNDSSTAVTETAELTQRTINVTDSNSSASDTAALSAANTVTDASIVVTDSSSKNVSAATTTQTARISLATAHRPIVRTDHTIHLRARKLNSAHNGEILVSLYEGATARTGELSVSALTTSLANYTLNITEADAANITNYSNLELRIRAVSSDGDPIQVEIAKVDLRIPQVGLVGTDSNAAFTDTSSLQIFTTKTGTESNTTVTETSALVIRTADTATGAEADLTLEINDGLTDGTGTDNSTTLSRQIGDSSSAVTEQASVSIATEFKTGNDSGNGSEAIVFSRSINDNAGGVDTGARVVLLTRFDSNTTVAESYHLFETFYEGFIDIEYPLTLQLAEVASYATMLGTPSSLQLIDNETSMQLQQDAQASAQINDSTTVIVIDNANSSAVLDSGQAELEIQSSDTAAEIGEYHPPIPS